MLVILGLLTGGILAGQSLIRAAELRSVASEQQRYRAAMYSFRDKYFALPGDMTNATRFWNARDAGDGLGVDCTAIAGTGTTTCNGNGNGVIRADGTFESRFFWQHLANAGLIEGNYNSVYSNAADTLGSTVPASKLSTHGWMPVSEWTHASLAGGSPEGRSVLRDSVPFCFAKAPLSDCGGPGTGLKPDEMWNIDTKLDDGNPVKGSVMAFGGCLVSGGGLDDYTFTLTDQYALTGTSTCSVALFF